MGLADGERVGLNDGLALGILRMKMFEIIGKSSFNVIRRKKVLLTAVGLLVGGEELGGLSRKTQT